MSSWIIIQLIFLLMSLRSTFGDYPLICPEKPHWNLRAKSLCKNVDDYRCLWDANYHRFIEQCSELNVQRKGFRKVIEGDITAGDCTANSYQPRMWTSKGNYDCEFQKSLCNDIGQVIYEDGGGITDRTCGCNHTAGYAFLNPTKNPCYCVPSEEDCTCVKKKCALHQKVDPEYRCRSIFRWKSWFSCPITPCGSIIQTSRENKIRSTVSPSVLTNAKTQEKTFPNKAKAFVAVIIILILFIGTGVVFLYKDSLFTKRLRSYIIYEGQNAFLSCEVVDDNLTVSWFINDIHISPGHPRFTVYSYQYSRELLISDVKRSENKMKITAMVGSEKSSATVVVRDSNFATKITNETVNTGGTAVFSCEVQDGNDTVQWFVNGGKISEDKRYTESVNGRHHELKIDDCRLEDDRSIVSVVRDREKITAHLFVVGQFKETIDKWISDDDMFIPTHAVEEVMRKIKDHNFVVVTGNSGTGKTFTVRHAALEMEKEGYVIVPADDPTDINYYFKPGCKTVFIFDDLCGRFTLNHKDFNYWKSHKYSLKTIFNDDCCKVLASCRQQVFNDKRIQSFISDVGGNECKICSSVDEKKSIIKKYFGKNEMTIADKNLSEFDSLPFLCSNFKNNNKNISELEKCIENPFDFYSEEFEKLFHEGNDGKRMCCALVLCVLYNNTLTSKDFSKKDNRVVLQCVLEKCSLSVSESPKKIKNAIESLIGVYITNDDGTYKISYDKLYNCIAKYFGEKMIGLFIKFAESGFVRERFVVRYQGMHSAADFVEISEDEFMELFMKRLVCDWENGDVYNVFNNTNMKSQEFRHHFLSYLKKKTKSSQRKLVHIRRNDETPLCMICFYGDLEFTKWMLDLGADVNLGKKDGKSPLQIVCQKGYTALVKLLLMCDQIDINYSTNDGCTALYLACHEEQGHVDVIGELLNHKADVNKSDINRISPLHIACMARNKQAVKLLMKHGADKTLRDTNGKSPMDIAVEENDQECISIISQS